MSDLYYLVNYGHGGFLSKFRSEFAHARGDRVVVQSPRGVEIGTVLSPGSSSTKGPPLEGEILRRATDDEESTAMQHRELGERLVVDAQSRAESLGLPLLFVDGEVLLEGQSAILQAIHWDDCDASELFRELSREFGLHVQFADLTASPKPEAKGCETCGSEKSGCDSCGTGGGCSTGSCSKGSVKSAEELTSYFAGLRKQMEAADGRVSLH